jgi:ankyrin repeat protein
MTVLLAMYLPTEKAKAVVKLLIELGASAAQADMNHVTTLHHVVAQGNHEILDMLLSNDRPVALSVLNHMSAGTLRNQCKSPLTTAIEKGHQDIVSKLLSVGAKPNINFDDWVKTYLAKNPWAKNQSKTFHNHVTVYEHNYLFSVISLQNLTLFSSGDDHEPIQKRCCSTYHRRCRQRNGKDR